MVDRISTGNVARATLLNVTLDRFLATDTTSIILAGFDRMLEWPETQSVSGNVLPYGENNTSFRLLRSGIWIIEIGVRCMLPVASTTGELRAHIVNFSTLTDYGGQTVQAPAVNAPLFNVWLNRSFNAGEVLECWLHNRMDKDVTIQAVPDLCHISFCYLGPGVT